MEKTIYLFDCDEKRIKLVDQVLSEEYNIVVISSLSAIPENHDDLVGLVIDPVIGEEFIEAVIEIIGKNPVPVFLWAPIGKPLKHWADMRLPVHLLPTPPSIGDIFRKMIPVLETKDLKSILIATLDKNLGRELSSMLADLEWDVKRVGDKMSLSASIESGGISLIFADLSLAENLCLPPNDNLPIPVVVNITDKASLKTSIPLNRMITVVPSSIGTKSLVDVIENAYIRAEKEIVHETGRLMALQAAEQSYRMVERLSDIALADARESIKGKRSEQLNLLNTQTLGLVNEFFEVMGDAVERSKALSKALNRPDLTKDVFRIDEKINSAEEILSSMRSVEWFQESGPTEPLSMERIVQDAISALKPTRRRKEIELNTDLSNLGTVVGNRKELAESLSNILINSYESLGDSGRIDIISHPDPNRNILSIRDSGSGFDPEKISFVTRPFYTTKSASHAGLGLTIARGTIKFHGGTMQIKSRPGVGTEILIDLPRASDKIKIEEEETRPDIILVAQKRSLAFLKAMLSKYGFTVVSTESVGDAVHVAKRHLPKMILVQAGMSFMDAHGIRMLVQAKHDAQLVLLDPQEKIPLGIKGLDATIRGTFPIHHLMSIVTAYLPDESAKQLQHTL